MPGESLMCLAMIRPHKTSHLANNQPEQWVQQEKGSQTVYLFSGNGYDEVLLAVSVFELCCRL